MLIPRPTHTVTLNAELQLRAEFPRVQWPANFIVGRYDVLLTPTGALPDYVC